MVQATPLVMLPWYWTALQRMSVLTRMVSLAGNAVEVGLELELAQVQVLGLQSEPLGQRAAMQGKMHLGRQTLQRATVVAWQSPRQPLGCERRLVVWRRWRLAAPLPTRVYLLLLHLACCWPLRRHLLR